jgi:hypothetical protein
VTRRLATCLLCLAFVGPVTTATATGGHPRQQSLPRNQVAGLPVQVYVDGLTPRVVRPHTQVVATGRLVNATSTGMTDLRVRARVRSRGVVSRSELAADAVRTDPIGEPLAATTTPVTTELGAGATVSFQLTVAADDLHLGAFGVYPFAVEVLGADAGGPNDIVGRTPTFLPWVPAGGGFRPTRLAWLVPLADVPNRAATPVFPDDHLAGSVGAGGRLSALLAAGTRVGPGTVRPPTPGRPLPPDAQRAVPVTWVADPALLQALADMSDGYDVARGGHSTARGAGQAAATAWLDALRRAMRGGPIPDTLLALPYADADVTALARAGLDADLITALTHGRDVTTSVVGVAPDSRLAWPHGGYVTNKGLDDLAASGARTVVLREAAVPLTEQLTYTPNAGTTLETPNGPVTALLYDDTIAGITSAAGRAVLAEAAKLPTVASPSPSSVPTPETPSPSPGTVTTAPTAATARLVEQRFLAETALITAERPLDSRDVIATPPLRWDPVPGLATALIADTGRVPWLAPTSLSSIAVADSVARGPLNYPPEAMGAELPESYLNDPDNGVVALQRDLSTFRSILAPPIGPTAVSLEDATLRAESAAWRDDLSAGLALRQQVAEDLTAKRNAVNISSSRRLITLASRRGTIPITISNDLDQAVVVKLQLSAVSSARLAAQVTAPQTIAPGRKLTEEVKAVVNQAGLFPVKAQLLTPDDEPYGPPVTLRLRSTAYGQLALGITAGALGALFLAVIIRLIRRGRGRRSPIAADST